MPTLDKHQSSSIVKLLALGDAKAGKTTSLVSLVAAGYKLRILDMDNLLDSLVAAIRKNCPDKLQNVDARTLRDKRAMTAAGPVLSGSAKAFTDAIRMLDRWKYKEGDEEIDLGVPASWGEDTILVIDSLSRLCDAAYDWRMQLAPTGDSGKFDGRAVYGDAQDAVEDMLAGLTSKSFTTNVIVICHGTYMTLPDGTTKIFPQGVGQKLSPKIPQYFPTYVRYRNVNNRRTLQLKSDVTIDLAVPMHLPDSLPVDTGLADLFKLLRSAPEEVTQPTKPTLKLKRA